MENPITPAILTNGMIGLPAINLMIQPKKVRRYPYVTRLACRSILTAPKTIEANAAAVKNIAMPGAVAIRPSAASKPKR